MCEGWVPAPDPGTYLLTAVLAEGSGNEYRQVLGSIVVEQADVEMQVLRGNDQALAALAEGTGGLVLDEASPGEFSEFMNKTLSARRVSTSLSPHYFWRTWYTFMTLLAVLGAEWYIRRREGLT